MAKPDLDVFTRGPLDPGLVLQGGWFRLPQWVENGPDGRPFRPWVGCWVDAESGVAFPPEVGSDEKYDPDILLRALARALADRRLRGRRPGRLRVKDEAVVGPLRAALSGTAMTVEAAGELEELDRLLADLRSSRIAADEIPGLLSGTEVTVEQVGAFADAAVRFHHAAPWTLLEDEDPIAIESALASEGLSLAVIMGSGGEEYGIAFFESREQYDSIMAGEGDENVIRLQGHWSITFVPGPELPIGDHDLWEDHGLPVHDDLYPLAIGLGPGPRVRRPDSRTLAYFEALLRALADTDEAEMDSGAWTKQVSTWAGPAQLNLSLPWVLGRDESTGLPGPDEPLDPIELLPVGDRTRAILEMSAEVGDAEIGDMPEDEDAEAPSLSEEALYRILFEGRVPSPWDRAQLKVWRAFHAPGRLRSILAREALEISPDCADAWLLLAEKARTPEEEEERVSSAVEAGRRAAGESGRRQDGGASEASGWDEIRLRPLLRALFQRALHRAFLGQGAEAERDFSELLRLDPADHQNARLPLIGLLLRARRDPEAAALLDRFPETNQPVWTYARALLAYRKGDEEEARRMALEAIRRGPLLWKFLTGAREIPDPEDREGGDDLAYAADQAELIQPAWSETHGAAEWLRAVARERIKARKSPSKGKPRGRRR